MNRILLRPLMLLLNPLKLLAPVRTRRLDEALKRSRGRKAAKHGDPEEPVDGGSGPGRVSRAGLLRAAVAGAAGLAGAESLSSPTPAAASGTMATNVTNLAEGRTAVAYDGTGNSNMLFVAGTSSTLVTDSAAYPAALGGWADGAGGMTSGVYGYTSVDATLDRNGVPTNGAVVAIDNSPHGSVGLLASSSAVAGVFAHTYTGYGVWGQAATSGDGVHGESGSGRAVVGSSRSGAGVYGTSVSSYGVDGFSDSGVGVHGRGSTYGGSFSGALAPLYLSPDSAPGAPTTANHQAGEFHVDSNGVVWICTASGTRTTPGTFKQVATTDLGLQPFPSPRRVYANASVPAGTTTVPIDATQGGTSGVPAGARAMYAAVQSQQAGVMTLYPDGANDPGIANWSGTGTNGTLNLLYMLVPLSAFGFFKIHTYFTGSIYVDAWGYLL